MNTNNNENYGQNEHQANRVKVAKIGEGIAKSFLRNKGYCIVSTRFRIFEADLEQGIGGSDARSMANNKGRGKGRGKGRQLGEIDLIALKGHILYLIELRTVDRASNLELDEVFKSRKRAKLLFLHALFVANKTNMLKKVTGIDMAANQNGNEGQLEQRQVQLGSGLKTKSLFIKITLRNGPRSPKTNKGNPDRDSSTCNMSSRITFDLDIHPLRTYLWI